MPTQTVRHTNTSNLVRIVQAGIAEGFNRTILPDWCEFLDPKGEHVVTFAMMHEHKGGQSTDPHMRVALLTKVLDQDEPVEILLDMSMEDFDTFTVTSAGKDNDADVQ